ncbi:MAG TPA: DUF3488 and transglutaminase-like domain-containing protein [Candidatus Limnocylindrales bacterium]
MTSRRHMTLVAAAATLMAAAPISSIFDSLSWFLRALIAVAMISGAAMAVRSVRGRLWAQVAAMAGALLVALTMFYSGGTSILGLIPSLATFSRFSELLTSAGTDIQTAFVPVPVDIDSLLFLTTLGIGGVAIIVDLLAVGMRRPALTGLPMLAIYSVPVAVYSESVNPIPFVIGAAGYLWLIVSDNVDKVRRFGRRFTGEGRGVDLWEPSPLAATGRRLAVVGVIVAVVLPVLIPGMTSGFLTQLGQSGAQGQGLGGSGRGGSVDLFANLHGKLLQPNEVDMVKVTTDDPAPFYLRFGVADEVQNNGFKHRTPSGAPVSANLRAVSGLERQAGSPRYKADIEVFKTFDMPMLPIYSLPVGTRGLDASWNFDIQQQIIYSPRARSAGKKFTVEFIHPSFEPDQLRTARALPDNHQVQQNFARVPEVAAVENLVTDLTKGKTTVYDTVRALYDYFSAKNGFTYDLSTKQGTTGQDITDFLEGKRGFCEQYAAALTWMVRAAGIPARVAFGFTKGNKFTGGTYTLTTRNLHAWTEVYFEGFGWVPFDATPAASVAGSVNSSWAPNVDAPEESENSANPTASPGAPGAENPADEFARDPGDECPECPTDGETPETPTPAWVWWTGGGAGGALILLLMPALRRQALRRRRSKFSTVQVTATDVTPGAPAMVVVADVSTARREAHAAWDELLDTMIDYRIAIDPAETPRTTAERLIRAEGLPTPTAEHARKLGYAEERARYAQQPVSPQGLVAAVREVRRVFASQAGRWVRITAVAFPPSVTQRWRAGTAAFGVGVSESISRFRTAVAAALRPLRLRRAR